ncbi:PLP-dependent aminotransferase family protein [Clostridium sp. DMHC 10]|uniref:aminotransferase-like domain-containing protein n=1 Tax=Clostridium sp. DMHC 10 TaxID=747377 RepID=UPI00069E2F92|nr:PLP-dependent aminotransferase family protein [Clostridium sp. DMHC 10]
MNISIKRNSKISVYIQIKNQIRDMIYSKMLPKAYVLPSERELAKTLEVNRSTVVKAYQELKADGLIASEIKKLMINREVRVSTENIMVTSGSQQGLDLIVRTFVNPDDVILVEEPTFFGALQLFQMLKAKVIGVPLDENGIRLDVLEYLIKKFNPKFIYTIPNFQNSTGITMSLKRRYELIKAIEKYGIPVIEDDPYGEIRYEGEELPPLKALDKNNYVIYLSTFSKTISLGLRVGWIAAPERVINKLSLFK